MQFSSARQELRVAFKRIEAELPPRLARAMRWLRHRDSRLIRIPAGLALMIGGVFSFLPVLGAWMLPLGLMLLAADVPPLQRPMRASRIGALGCWNASGVAVRADRSRSAASD